MRKLMVGLAIALVVVIAGVLLARPVGQEEYSVEPPPPPPSPVSLQTRLLFGGDVYWGRLFERNAPGDYAFPFSGLNTLNKPNYDAWIANVECPITDEIVSFEAQWEAIQFNCLPEYLPEAAKWFDVVSLANNHTDNVRGQEGIETTRANLEAAGIQHFGHYEPTKLSDVCEVVSIDARLSIDDGTTQVVGLPIALCGYHGVFKAIGQAEIVHMTQYANHFITIAMPHAGAEYQTSSDELRQQAYRAMVDAGADVVLGNHPHWVQNTEAYKGKLIAYSMGNFIFDQQFNSEVTRSALFDLTFDLAYSEDLQVYLDTASQCVSYQDKCLSTIQTSSAAKPEFDITYEVVPTRTTNLITQRDPAGRAPLLERLNWEQTLSQLQ